MKKSLLKRAIAAASVVPLALTQCFTVMANAVSVDDTNVALEENIVNAGGVITKSDIFDIAAAEKDGTYKLDTNRNSYIKISSNNILFGDAIVGTETNGTFDIAKYFNDAVAGKSFTGMNAKIIEAIKENIKADDASYTIKDGKVTFVINFTQEEFDAIVDKTAAETARKIAQKYEKKYQAAVEEAAKYDIKVPAIDFETLDITKLSPELVAEYEEAAAKAAEHDIKVPSLNYVAADFSNVKGSLTATITVDANELSSNDKVSVTAVFEDADGKKYTLAQVPGFFKEKMQVLKDISYASIATAEEFSEDEKAEARKEVDDSLADTIKLCNRAEAKIVDAQNQVLENNTNSKFAATSDLISGLSAKSIVKRLAQKVLNSETLPTSAAAILSKGSGIINGVLDEVGNALPYTFELSASDIGSFADTFTNIKLTFNGGIMTIAADVADNNKDDAKAYVDDTYMVDAILDEIHNEIEITVDFASIKSDSAAIKVQYERVVPFNTTTTTTTTTTGTSTTTTTGTGSTTTDTGSTTTTTGTGSTTTDTGSTTTTTGTGSTTTDTGSTTTTTYTGSTTTGTGSTTTDTGSTTTTTGTGSTTTDTGSTTTTTGTGSTTTDTGSTTTTTGTGSTTTDTGSTTTGTGSTTTYTGSTTTGTGSTTTDTGSTTTTTGTGSTTTDTGSTTTGTGSTTTYTGSTTTGTGSTTTYTGSTTTGTGSTTTYTGSTTTYTGSTTTGTGSTTTYTGSTTTGTGSTTTGTGSTTTYTGSTTTGTGSTTTNTGSTTTTTGTGSTTTDTGSTTTTTGTGSTTTDNRSTTTTTDTNVTTTTGTDVTTTTDTDVTTTTGTDVTTTTDTDVTTTTDTDVTTTTDTDVTTTTDTDVTTTTDTDVTTTTDTDVTTTTDTDVTTTTDTDVTTTTDTDVTTTTDTDVTTTTTTEPIEEYTTYTTNAVVYNAKSTPGFYLNVDEEFNVGQLLEVTYSYQKLLVYEDADGNIVKTEVLEKEDDVTVSTNMFGFGEKTPANTYVENGFVFAYQIPIVAEEDITDADGNVILAKGQTLKNANGEDVTVTTYIGVKGDADFDGVADSTDASAVLAWYANASTGADLSTLQFAYDINPYIQAAVENNDLETAEVYDNLAAFLCDIDEEYSNPSDYQVNKGDRTIDSSDASFILGYYSRISTGEPVGRATWDSVTEFTKAN